jgi:protein-disulfide isomerase
MIGARSRLVGAFVLICCAQLSFSATLTAGEITLKQSRLPDGVVLWTTNQASTEKPPFFSFLEDLAKIVLPSRGELPFDRSIAFLIGVSKYRHLDSLPFARNDLNDMRDYLLLRGGFDQVYIVSDEVANAGLVEKYMMNIFPQKLQSRDRLLFYYAGHGADAHGTTGYLQFANASPDDFAQDVLPISRVYEWSSVNRAAHMLYLLDTCASGLAFAPRAGTSTSDEQRLIQTLSSSGSRAVVTAGTAEEQTFEVKDSHGRGNGIFTRSFLAALEKISSQETAPVFLTIGQIFSSLQISMARFAAENRKPLHPRLWPLNEDEYTGSFVFLNPSVQYSKVPQAQLSKLKATLGRGTTIALGRVDGKPITDAEVRKSAADQFAQLQHEYESSQHQLLESQLDQVIEDRLLEAEAAARKISKEQILADLKPPVVTDAEVDAFYEQNKAQIPRPKDEIAIQIKNYLEQKGQAEARQKFFDDLQVKYKVEKNLEPIRMEVAATGPAQGPANAPVTIVEFADFQCPFCARLVPTLQKVRQKYGDKIRFVFRQYPLSMHPNAQKAAEASLCANEQGKFWEMHDSMFTDQEELAVDNLKSKAAALGLKAEEFNSCLDSGKYVSQIQSEVKDGTAVGVNGTPAMFINGRFVNGAVPIEEISSIIDDELRRRGGV